MSPYLTQIAPTMPAITVSRMGLTLKRMFRKAARKKTTAKKTEIVPKGSENRVFRLAPGFSNTPNAIVMAADAINPTAAGFIPKRNDSITLF